MTTAAGWRSPIFVVGPSRSGTTMLSKMLGRHALVEMAPETHFFDDLRPRIRGERLAWLEPAALDVAVNHFRALSHRVYGKQGDPERGWLTRAALLERAEACGGTPEGLFAAYCQLHAERRKPGAAVWGEKTPRNSFHIDEILAAFPEARVVCMVRDPRACVASYRDWTYQGDGSARDADPEFRAAAEADYRRAQLSYHVVIATLTWRATVNTMLDAAARHGPERVRVLRYEDVVAGPEAALRDLAGWAGLDYEPDMLEVPLVNSSYAPAAGGGIDAGATERWRGRLSDREVNVVQRVAGATMTRAGYAPQAVRTGPLDMARAYASLPFVAARAVMVNRERAANIPAYAWRRLRAAMK